MAVLPDQLADFMGAQTINANNPHQQHQAESVGIPQRIQQVAQVIGQHGRRQLVLSGPVVSTDQLPHVIVIQRLPAGVVAVFLYCVAKQRTNVIELHHPT